MQPYSLRWEPMITSPIPALWAERGVLPLQYHRRETLCHQYLRFQNLPSSHPLTTFYSTSNVDLHNPVWLPGARQPLNVRALHALALLNISSSLPQPTSPVPPMLPWQTLCSHIALHIPDLPPKPSTGTLAATLFIVLDQSTYRDHTKVYMDGSRCPVTPSTGAAIYIPNTGITKTWKLPCDTDITTAELFAIQQAVLHLISAHFTTAKAVLYTDSRSSLHLLFSRRPSTSITLVYSIQRLLLSLQSRGWEIVLQWVPSHSNIRGNVIVNTAARMALSNVNIYCPPPAVTLH
ncbi:hypothetical protein E2C01_070824 [Portunus trituberculatus]|uniref:RNase H type-1 domain-containing protein n=1 Tax=Portunus trituberculatus TaxID=210409 RepID=A0A5B7I6H6_PORTR|nr:hypothetical protein [Portunus trituberculatus]